MQNKPCYSTNTLERVHTLLKEYIWTTNQYKTEGESILSRLEILKSQLSKAMELTYPNNCNLPCQLKQHKSTELDRLTSEIDKLESKLNELRQQFRHSKSVKNRLESLDEGRYPQIQKMAFLEDFFVRNSQYFYSKNPKHFINVLNNNSSLLINRISKMLQYLKNLDAKETIEQRIKVVEERRDILLKSKVPADKIMNDQLAKNKAKLEIFQKEYSNLNAKIIDVKNKLNDLEEANELVTQAKSQLADLLKVREYVILKYQIDSYNLIIEHCNNLKTDILIKLHQLDISLQEQSNLKTRLNDEVLVVLKQCEDQLQQYELLEKSLSPICGIPHTYVVNYLNALITNVNAYIESVWGYSLQLEYFDVNKPIDYNLKIKVGRSIVKDISLCSRGQKEIVDLAWILALYRQLELVEYPLKFDEVDSALSEGNRSRLLELLSGMMRNREIGQLFLINHHSSLYSSFLDCQTLCLNGDDILLPSEYNQHTTIE